MSSIYLWIKWAHIVSSTVLFGMGAGIAYFFVRAHRTGDAKVIAAVGRDVVLADGNVDALEANLMRRVAALLFVSDADSGAARRRVLARNGAPAAANGDPE